MHIRRPTSTRTAQSIGNVQLTRSTGLHVKQLRAQLSEGVDAYTGDVKFYVLDGDDPIISAWQERSPTCLLRLPRCQMSCESTCGTQDLFRVQTECRKPDFR